MTRRHRLSLARRYLVTAFHPSGGQIECCSKLRDDPAGPVAHIVKSEGDGTASANGQLGVPLCVALSVQPAGVVFKAVDLDSNPVGKRKSTLAITREPSR